MPPGSIHAAYSSKENLYMLARAASMLSANLILRNGADHPINSVHLRKL